MTNLLLWDLDGTLSDDRHRAPLYHAGLYAEYFSYAAQMEDPPYPEALALYHEMKLSGWKMGYLTARMEQNRKAAVDWLNLHSFDNPEFVFLRPDSQASVRPPDFKSNILGRLIESGKYEKIMHIDNDPLVIERMHIDHGPYSAFLADWDANPSMRSIHNLSSVVLEP